MSRFERPHYFAGKLLTADDLELEQRYHIEKRWLLNRTFHGEGVVHGLEVAPGKGTVSVSPGFAVDEYGREIEVCERQELALPDSIEPISICIRYAEVETDRGTVCDCACMVSPVAAKGRPLCKGRFAPERCCACQRRSRRCSWFYHSEIQ